MTFKHNVVSMLELTDEDLTSVLGTGGAAGATGLGGCSACGGAAFSGLAGFNLGPVIAQLNNQVGADISMNLNLSVRPSASTNALVQIN